MKMFVSISAEIDIPEMKDAMKVLLDFIAHCQEIPTCVALDRVHMADDDMTDYTDVTKEMRSLCGVSPDDGILRTH